MQTQKRNVAFGEIMLRLAPPDRERLLQSPRLAATFGGNEANAAVALAQLGLPVSFVTVLPVDNPVADACAGELRSFGARYRHYDLGHIVDGVGAGDSFAGAFIYGWQALAAHAETLEFAVAASCLKHTVPGDFSRYTVEEVNALLRLKVA